MDISKPTLTVKSPSDRVPSRVIAYDQSWSVKDLKEHLCETYPTHPPPSAQRLIYAGKLLSDETGLSTVFKNALGNPTLHLVCRNIDPVPPATPQPADVSASSSTTNTDPISSIPAGEMQEYQRQYYEYLRNFYVASSNPSQYMGDSSSSNVHTTPASSWTFSPPWGLPGVPAPNYLYYPMHPSYAPFTSTDGAQAGSNGGDLSAEPVLPDWNSLNPVEPVPANDVPAGQNPQPPAQQQQGMLVGNPMAGGLLGGDELGDNGGNLDIVDRFYLIFRLALFIGLCFAYSSLDKAIIVFSVAAYVYLYNIYRRHAAFRRAVPAVIPLPANPPEQPAEANPSASRGESNATEENPTSSETQLRQRNTSTPQEQQHQPEQQPVVYPESRLIRFASSVRLVLTVSFQFLSSLITSLVPEQPPPIRLD